MLKLAYIAYHSSGGEFYFQLHESTFPQRDFVRILLNCAVALPLHQVHAGGAGKARFNVATPTYEARTRPLHVQHKYYRIIFKQNPFNIISREVQGCTSADFRLK